ncbi:MAG: hypothetical protein LW825_06545 [Candidatus Jidaibacter sp.]|jgi:hypothetical protein|nr:hypothetical protein [Candidatus Jidaibacter sp.]
MLGSIFDPRKNGIKPILLVSTQFILSVYYNEIFGLAIDRNQEYEVHTSPMWAVKRSDLEGLKSALCESLLFSFKYSASEFLMNYFSGYINESVNDLLPKFITEKVYKNTDTCFFLNDVVGCDQKKLSELTHNWQSITGSVLKLIKAPIEIYQIYTTSRRLLIFLKPMAPFLPFPLNNEYVVMGSIASLIFARVGAEIYLDKKSNALSAELNKAIEFDNDNKEFALESASEIRGRNLEAAMNGLDEVSSAEKASINNKLNFIGNIQQYLSIDPLAKSMLIMLCGTATILYTEVSYKHVFKPIIFYAGELLNLGQGLIGFYHLKNSLMFGKNNLNELTGKISEAEKLISDGQGKIGKPGENKLLEAENLGLTFSGRRRKLSDLSVSKGEIVRLKGKSAFLDSVLFGAFIEQGEIKRTNSYCKSGEAYLPVLGFSLIQDIAGSSIIEDAKLGAINGLLQQFEINSNTNSYDLNDEQKQIVKLISTFVSGKDLVILEKPFNWLSEENLTKCLKLIKIEAEKGRGFLIINDIEREDFYTKTLEMTKVKGVETALDRQWFRNFSLWAPGYRE